MGLSSRLMFDLWYLFRPPWETCVSPPELLEFIAACSPGAALDLGCGTGTNVVTLARHGWRATGVDFSWRSIRMARRKARRSGVEVDLRVRDVTEPGALTGLYNLVLDMGCFHGLPERGRRSYIQNLEQLLAGGGTYLLYVFFKEGTDRRGPGVTEGDLAAFSGPIELDSRVDGSERGRRPSAWLTFRRP